MMAKVQITRHDGTLMDEIFVPLPVEYNHSFDIPIIEGSARIYGFEFKWHWAGPEQEPMSPDQEHMEGDLQLPIFKDPNDRSPDA